MRCAGGRSSTSVCALMLHALLPMLPMKRFRLAAAFVGASILAGGRTAAQSENVEFRSGTFDLALPAFLLDGSVAKGEQSVDFSVGNVSIQRIEFKRTDVGDLRRI